MTINLNAQTRTSTGSSVARSLRRSGEVPAIIYGLNKKNINIKLSQNDLLIAIKKQGFMSSVLNLTIDEKKKISVIVKDHAMHVIKKQIMHIDFYETSNKAEISVKVPLDFVNQEKSSTLKSGGSLDINTNEIEIKCLSSDLPSVIEVDVSNFAGGTTIHQSDLVLPKGVVINSNIDSEHDLPIASINLPKAKSAEKDKE
jgi:large subunit ribosomal protein L25